MAALRQILVIRIIALSVMEGRNAHGIFEMMSEPNRPKIVCFRMKHPLHVVLLACVSGASLAACDNSDYRDSAAMISGEEQLRLLTSLSEIEGFWLIAKRAIKPVIFTEKNCVIRWPGYSATALSKRSGNNCRSNARSAHAVMFTTRTR